MHTGILSCAAAAMLLSACTGSISGDHYSMVESMPPAAFIPGDEIRINLDPLLDQNRIVMQTDAFVLHQASSYIWAQPLSRQLSVILKNELLQQGIDPATKFEVYVSRFYGNLQGEAVTAAHFVIRHQQQSTVYDDQAVCPLQADGYSALTAALQQCWIKLSRNAALQAAAIN